MNGKYGFATEKSGEVPDAIKKALVAARKELFTIHLAKGNTLAHEIVGEFAATKVYLKPAPLGTGIIAGGAVRALLELAGVKNVCSKVYGSRTPINVVRATHDALQKLKEYDKIMVLRGLKTTDQIKALHPAVAAKPAAQHFEAHQNPHPYVKPAYSKAAAPIQASKPAAPAAVKAAPTKEGDK